MRRLNDSIKNRNIIRRGVVEYDCVEYKAGWNPNAIINSICAFANDYDNTNGGYIVIGVKEKDGMPVFPVEGLPKENLDIIQQEIIQYCNMIVPRYIPRMEIIDYKKTGTFLVYLWCLAGDSGPYQAPHTVYGVKGEKIDKIMKYWIRPASLTTDAKQDEVSELFDKFNSVPYDDRINRKARIDDIRRGYMEDFIRKSNSSLINELNNRSLEDLLLAQEVADETDTEIDIRNIGVLMFAEHPEKLIPGAQIELIRFNTEEAERFYNYPGLAKWINLEKFEAGKIRGRKYRNRRIGELFKEIDLSEKKGTGISKIIRELRQNGSPEPEFEMDNDRNYLNTIIYIRSGFEKTDVTSGMNKNVSSEALNEALNKNELVIVNLIKNNPAIKQKDIVELTGISRSQVQRIMKSLQERNIIMHEDSKKTGRWIIW